MLNIDTESSTTSESESDSRSEYSTSTQTSTSENDYSEYDPSKENFVSFVVDFFNLFPDNSKAFSSCKEKAKRLAEIYYKEKSNKIEPLKESGNDLTTSDQDLSTILYQNIVNFSKFLEKECNIKFFKDWSKTTKGNEIELVNRFSHVFESILGLSNTLKIYKKFQNTIDACKKILKPKRDFLGRKIKPRDGDFLVNLLEKVVFLM